MEIGQLATAMKGVEAVWHLAGNIDIPGGLHQTDLDLRYSVVGTYNVLEAMRRSNVRDILFASSGAVYGNLSRDDQVSEDVGPLLPMSLYAAGKLGAESMISGYCHLFGLRGLIFRFGNIVGSRMTRGAIHDFIAKLSRTPDHLEILGDGHQRKPYLLVEDCLAAMGFAFQSASLTETQPVDIFNIAVDSTTSAQAIGHMVIEEMGLKGVSVTFTGGEQGWPGDQPQVRMSSAKLASMGWNASRTSDDAVREAIRRMLRQKVASGF